MSSRAPFVVLDPSFVQNYIDAETSKAAGSEKGNMIDVDAAGSDKENVIDVDALDDSVEYVQTTSASPRTKQIAKVNERIFLLENQIASMKKRSNAKQNCGDKKTANFDILESTNSSASSIEPQSSFSGASTSSVSLNSSNSMANISGLNASDLGDFNEAEVNKFIEEWNANGQLLDLATEVIDYCEKKKNRAIFIRILFVYSRAQ